MIAGLRGAGTSVNGTASATTDADRRPTRYPLPKGDRALLSGLKAASQKPGIVKAAVFAFEERFGNDVQSELPRSLATDLISSSSRGRSLPSLAPLRSQPRATTHTIPVVIHHTVATPFSSGLFKATTGRS